MDEKELPTVTVLRSWTARRADCRAGIVLETLEQGSLVIELNLKTIEIVRGQLRKLESYLKTPPSRA